MNKIYEFVRDNQDVYKNAQALIELWDKITAVMREQNVDLEELSYRTQLPESELRDCLENYADAKVSVLLKIMQALKVELALNNA